MAQLLRLWPGFDFLIIQMIETIERKALDLKRKKMSMATWKEKDKLSIAECTDTLLIMSLTEKVFVLLHDLDWL